MAEARIEGRAADGTESHQRLLSRNELAARSGSSSEQIDELVSARLLAPTEQGHPVEDVQRVRLIEAFLAAGVPLATLARAKAEGRITFDYYGELHAGVGDASGYTYGDLRTDARTPKRLPALYAALGLAEPEPASPLSTVDADLVRTLLDIVSDSPDDALMLRVVRLLGEAARRATTGALDIYAEAVSHDPALSGLPSEAAFDEVLRPWSRLARVVPDLARWLTAQHMSRAIEAYIVEATERRLGADGLLPVASDAPPGVAFVDLSGFTRLTEARGDEAAAAIALRLGDVASETADRHAGRVVKLLGDGVLMVFRRPADAVEASLALLGALAGQGLPAGHAGVHAGPVVARDGDVFGRTVNLASRLADAASDGELLVTDAVLARMPRESVSVAEGGQRALQGIGEVVVYRVTRRS